MAAHLIDERTKATGPFWWLRRVLAWTVLLAVTAVLVLAVALPRVGGATPYAILTGSMKPSFPPGTLVVMRPVDADDIGVGTVITYQLESGEQTVVTHRVAGVAINPKGERVFITQGDANNIADEKMVRPVQIRGALWYSVPALGYANRYLTSDQRSQLTFVVAAALLAYAVWSLVTGLRDRRRSRSLGPVPGPAHLRVS